MTPHSWRQDARKVSLTPEMLCRPYFLTLIKPFLFSITLVMVLLSFEFMTISHTFLTVGIVFHLDEGEGRYGAGGKAVVRGNQCTQPIVMLMKIPLCCTQHSWES